jgi:hypothetical protein
LPKLTDNEVLQLESDLMDKYELIKNTANPDVPDVWARLKAIEDEMTIRDLGLSTVETDGLYRLQKKGVGLFILRAIDLELMRRAIV